jgi:hypothetical protein
MAKRWRSGESSQAPLRKQFVMHLLCWDSNVNPALHMGLCRLGKRFMISCVQWRHYRFLAFGAKVSGKSHRDTPANFSTRVMCTA